MPIFRSITFSLLLLLTLGGAALARPVRVATYNIEHGVGTVGSAKYLAISSILARVDADIVGFQELQTDTRTEWETLAASLGYEYTAFGESSGFLSGPFYNGYYSRFPILSTHNVFSPPGANEISRPPFRAVIDVPETAAPLVLWNLHHKALSGQSNEFRRAVESIRCAQDIELYLNANPTHLDYIVFGDMNADVTQPQSAQFFSLPSDLPFSYSLGSDITFPVPYAVFPRDAYEPAGHGMAMLPAFHQNSSAQNTFIFSSGRLDYIFVSSNVLNNPLGAPATEVYNSNRDSGAGGLPKVGDPLPAGTSSTASDHYLVFADIQMTPAFSMRVTPTTSLASSGPAGGPFSPSDWVYTITNASAAAFSWEVQLPPWLTTANTSGALSPGATQSVSLSLSPAAHSLPTGAYTAAVAFVNLSDGTGNTTRSATLDVHEPSGLFEDAESGGPGWSATGLWRIVDDSSLCWQAGSGAHLWWYGDPATCTYDVGTTRGELTSPPFFVPPNAILSFWSWEETEGDGLVWDRRIVQISVNDGVTWTSVYQSAASTADWRFKTVDLSAYDGQTARIRFVFDSINEFANNFRGWYLDDISVAPPGELAASAPLLRIAGEEGGPFEPDPYSVVLTNLNAGRLLWDLVDVPAWLTPTDTTGALGAGESTSVTLNVNGTAALLPGGLYNGTISFTNAVDAANTATLDVQLLVRDGIPDDWRLFYFGHIEPNAATLSRADDDADGDGMTNWEEYIANTNPLDPLSRLLLPDLHWDAGNLILRFPSSLGRVYSIEYNNDIANKPLWNTVVDFQQVPGTGGIMTYIDDGSGTTPHPDHAPARTYRLRVGLP